MNWMKPTILAVIAVIMYVVFMFVLSLIYNFPELQLKFYSFLGKLVNLTNTLKRRK